MRIQTIYIYTLNGKTVVSPKEPQEPYTVSYRVIADADGELYKGNEYCYVIDTDNPSEWAERITSDVDNLRELYATLKDKYNSAEAKAERLDRIKAKIIELRDKATLQTTKAIYNAILELFEDET